MLTFPRRGTRLQLGGKTVGAEERPRHRRVEQLGLAELTRVVVSGKFLQVAPKPSERVSSVRV